MKTVVQLPAHLLLLRASALLFVGVFLLSDFGIVAAEREGAPRPGVRREGEGPARRGPRDGEGPMRRGSRDGEGGPARGPRDGEGGMRRGPGDAGFSAERAQQGINIRLNEQGQVLSSANKAVAVSMVRSTLKRIAATQKTRPVIIRAPKATPFGNVVMFVKECEQAGIRNIRFATQ